MLTVAVGARRRDLGVASATLLRFRWPRHGRGCRPIGRELPRPDNICRRRHRALPARHCRDLKSARRTAQLVCQPPRPPRRCRRSPAATTAASSFLGRCSVATRCWCIAAPRRRRRGDGPGRVRGDLGRHLVFVTRRATARRISAGSSASPGSCARSAEVSQPAERGPVSPPSSCSCSALVSPLFFQVVIDKVLVHRSISTLDVLLIGLVAISVFEAVLRQLAHLSCSRTPPTASTSSSARRLFRHLLALPIAYFQSPPGRRLWWRACASWRTSATSSPARR